MTPVNFISTIRTGFVDCLNPGSMTAVIIFSCFMFWMVKWQNQSRMILFGSSFIVGLALTTVSVNLGIFDNLLSSKIFDTVLDWAHFIIEVASLAVGMICLRDWWIYRKTQDQRKLIIRYPFMAQVEPGSKIVRTRGWMVKILLMVLCYFCGAATALLASAWPGDQNYFSVLRYRILSPGVQMESLLLLISYGFAFTFLLIMELIGFKIIMNFSKVSPAVSLSKAQIITAALFLAYGATMLYLFYIRFYIITH